MQRTVVILKPDALQRGLVGEIIGRFEKIGAKVVGLKLLQANRDQALKHYTEELAKRRGEAVRKIMVEAIQSGPIVAMVVEGIDIVEVARKLVGETEPKAAIPGTIRGDYAHVSFDWANKNKKPVYNLIHASASLEEAEAEIKVWFSKDELVEFDPTYSKLTL